MYQDPVNLRTLQLLRETKRLKPPLLFIYLPHNHKLPGPKFYTIAVR
jgi:hypothetical protein